MTTVLITGATGLVGRAASLRLQCAGYGVIALVRDKDRARRSLGAEVELMSERDGGPSLIRALGRTRAILNLAGAPVSQRWTRSHKQAIAASRIDSTRRLVSAIDATAQRPRVLVSASAVGYYGDRGSEQLVEASQAGVGFLADLCRQWEAEALRATSLGVRVVCLRIGVVLAPGGGALAKMLPPFRAGFGGPLGNGRQYMPWIHIDDLLDIVVRALEDDSLSGAVNAVAPEIVTNRTFAKTLARAVARPALMAVPGPMLRLALGQMAHIVLASQRVLPAKLSEIDHGFHFATLEPALRDVLARGAANEARAR